MRRNHVRCGGVLALTTAARSECTLSCVVLLSHKVMEYDVVTVGAGPAGLAAAIRLKQLAIEKGQDLSVCVVEKGAEVGAHILSGNVFEPKALDELIPEWREMGAPVDTPVKDDQFLVLSESSSLGLPNLLLPPQLVSTEHLPSSVLSALPS